MTSPATKTVTRHTCRDGRMVESETGSWVHYDEVEPLLTALQKIADEPRQPMGDARNWAYKLHSIACVALHGGNRS